jgi:hypothetical protein
MLLSCGKNMSCGNINSTGYGLSPQMSFIKQKDYNNAFSVD